MIHDNSWFLHVITAWSSRRRLMWSPRPQNFVIIVVIIIFEGFIIPTPACGRPTERRVFPRWHPLWYPLLTLSPCRHSSSTQQCDTCWSRTREMFSGWRSSWRITGFRIYWTTSHRYENFEIDKGYDNVALIPRIFYDEILGGMFHLKQPKNAAVLNTMNASFDQNNQLYNITQLGDFNCRCVCRRVALITVLYLRL